MAHKEQSGDLKFKSITLQKKHPLGVGSYGSVFRANCDDLVCAAKIIHPTLVPTGHDEPSVSAEKVHRLPIKRFEAECSFMKEIRHPYIVQYLGMFQDQDTGLPVLLLELMDESLTHFLENESEVTVSYSIQLKLCSDVTCALSFLHSNEIVHRDLSSNNILLIGRYQAKLSDFGMAKFLSHNNSQISNTICPGTDAYMPPEALDNAVFTDKGDLFSFGVNIIQILTRKFPAPGDRFKTLHIDHPQIPQGSIDVRVSEVERRIVDINSIESSHPLLPIALRCLKDKAYDRPTASELCKRFLTLKTQIRPQQETAITTEHIHVKQTESTDINLENEKLKQVIKIQATQLNVLQQELQTAKRIIIAKEKQVTSSEEQNEYLGEYHKRADTESTTVDTILPPVLPPKGIPKHQLSKQKVGIRKVPLFYRQKCTDQIHHL